MATKFLQEVATIFATKDNFNDSSYDYLSNYTFIFPNRRSSIFFKKYLGEKISQPLFSPKILTISDLFTSLNNTQVAPHLAQMLHLWKAWQRGTQSEESLDDFLYWGDLLLSDFADIDQYLVDAKQLFQNLSDLKELEGDYSWMSQSQIEAVERITQIKNFWNKLQSIDSSKKNDFKEKFLKEWSNLFIVYTQFKERLLRYNLATSAMQYRFVAEAIIAYNKGGSYDLEIIEKLNKFNKIVFIGFSAPTSCEKILMKYCKSNGALFYWDYYSNWVKSEHNRSSFLISKCVEEFDSDLPITNNEFINDSTNNIPTFDIYPVSGNNQQIQVASQILKRWYDENGEDINNAVVLSDESMIIPFLNAIPSCYKDLKGDYNVNITMGYPLKMTQLYSLITSFITLYSSINRKKERNNASYRYYFLANNLINLLSHPYISNIDGIDSEIQKLIKSKLYFTDINTLRENSLLKFILPSDSIINSLFDKNQGDKKDSKYNLFKGIVNYHKDFFAHIMQIISLQTIERHFFYKYFDILNELLEQIDSLGLELARIRTINSIITNSINSASFSFAGEPLKGLQIMGPLETRLLDFDNILFLSFNEGIFPRSGEQKSSIPYFLRKHFGLPTYEFQDSISAYNFYRLTQRAKHIYCIYDNSKGDKIKYPEESRFIKQLKYDFLSENQDSLRYHYPKFNYIHKAIQNIQYGKIDKKEETLNTLIHKEFSPSLLNLYIDCPLKFYLCGVEKFSTDRDIEEHLDKANFGTIFHECMRNFYNKLIGNSATPTKIDKDSLNNYINPPLTSGKNSSLEAVLKIDDVFFSLGVKNIEGENLIIREIVKQYIEYTLMVDYDRAMPFYYLESEMAVNNIKTSGGYNLKGFFDRVELIADSKKPVIIDYKTSSVSDIKKIEKSINQDYSDITDIENLMSQIFDYSGERNKWDSYLFQLMLYALMFSKKYGDDDRFNLKDGVDVGIYPIQQIRSKAMLRFSLSLKMMESFEEHLNELFDKIFDKKKEKYWRQNLDSSACQYCDCVQFCNRR